MTSAEGLDTRRKILPVEELKPRLREHRARGESVVLLFGEFDLLDAQRARDLERARKEGDVLVVAVESDAQVRTRKGCGRPIVSAEGRAQLVAALRVVDYVTFPSSTGETALLEALQPDVCVPGGSGQDAQAVCDAAQSAGIRVARLSQPDEGGGMDLPERLRRLHHA